eukprot:3541628-Lingulodinium_polyedra.AAC.1
MLRSTWTWQRRTIEAEIRALEEKKVELSGKLKNPEERASKYRELCGKLDLAEDEAAIDKINKQMAEISEPTS